MPNDTITVSAKKEGPGFFSRVLGIDSADIGAHATAITGVPTQVLHVAPMVVYCDHPLTHNCNGSHIRCPDVARLRPLGAPGAFGILNLDGGNGHLQSYTVHGNNATLDGYFTTYLASGILAEHGGGSTPDFGIRSVQLIG
jgi:hypothetical protein